jgi:hypothetical protein
MIAIPAPLAFTLGMTDYQIRALVASERWCGNALRAFRWYRRSGSAGDVGIAMDILRVFGGEIAATEDGRPA